MNNEDKLKAYITNDQATKYIQRVVLTHGVENTNVSVF